MLTAFAFPDAFLAADAVPRALEHKPIGLEGFDGMLVDFMQRKHLAVDECRFASSGRRIPARRDGRMERG